MKSSLSGSIYNGNAENRSTPKQPFRLLHSLLLFLFLLSHQCTGQLVSSDAQGDSCLVTLWLTQMTAFDITKNRIRAGFWMASDCTDSSVLSDFVEFASAEEPPDISYSTSTSSSTGGTLSYYFVSGYFVDFFSLKRWPFDSHNFNIVIESLQNVGKVKFRMDPKSGYKPDMHLADGWTVVSFEQKLEEIAFGSPLGQLLGGHEVFDRITFTTTIMRSDASAFVRAIGVPISATVFGFVLVTLSVTVFPQLAVRVSGTVGMFFSVVISFLRLPPTSYMKMVDFIHLYCITVILLLFELALLWLVLHSAKVTAARNLVLSDKALGILFLCVWTVGLGLIPSFSNSDNGLWVLVSYLCFSHLVFCLVIGFFFRGLWRAYVRGPGEGEGKLQSVEAWEKGDGGKKEKRREGSGEEGGKEGQSQQARGVASEQDNAGGAEAEVDVDVFF
uniref:Neurotransmitter-gated ion-channel ligand-binding domain-containing protein n=1 Tax=Chromera velia CCMP2878 TaxID=1169474 RepID=A0A0G4I0V3_9ALVE|eukprot:Cvel_9998.t1-p1 / transcript=Cvel_9998.t1 / gene=Cvel_9998 / organism=Chromera_velia_CCMP2878 / gene_product=hypothetical protein / transcript_product=hypothetical protein / location=Cvel_scaffold592:34991-38305(-) / protein_length=444 / sequence_SO=supercontig / SO=protein_coding / is_pseudo=false